MTIFSRKTFGFTLVEILVVVVIAGLMLAVVPAALSKVIPSSQVKSAARYLAASLKSTRNQAVISHEEKTLILNVEDKTYTVDKKKRTLDLPEDTSLTLITAKSEQIDENIGAIRFFTDGSSTGGQIKIGYKQFEYFVDVNWLTGKVSITP